MGNKSQSWPLKCWWRNLNFENLSRISETWKLMTKPKLMVYSILLIILLIDHWCDIRSLNCWNLKLQLDILLSAKPKSTVECDNRPWGYTTATLPNPLQTLQPTYSNRTARWNNDTAANRRQITNSIICAIQTIREFNLYNDFQKQWTRVFKSWKFLQRFNF